MIKKSHQISDDFRRADPVRYGGADVGLATAVALTQLAQTATLLSGSEFAIDVDMRGETAVFPSRTKTIILVLAGRISNMGFERASIVSCSI